MSNFMKIRPVGAELFHADRRTDGQTDMTKIIVAFRNFVNAPKEERNRHVKLLCYLYECLCFCLVSMFELLTIFTRPDMNFNP